MSIARRWPGPMAVAGHQARAGGEVKAGRALAPIPPERGEGKTMSRSAGSAAALGAALLLAAAPAPTARAADAAALPTQIATTSRLHRLTPARSGPPS